MGSIGRWPVEAFGYVTEKPLTQVSGACMLPAGGMTEGSVSGQACPSADGVSHSLKTVQNI
jgi:hypothetical protein